MSGLGEAVAENGGVGRGSRLVHAFDRYPALGYSRERLLLSLGRPAAHDEIVAAIESDPALVLATLRRANRRRPPARAICGVPGAVEELGPDELHGLASGLSTFESLGPACGAGGPASAFRLHALATLRAMECLLARGRGRDPDALRVAALLHDIGKLVLPADRQRSAGTPGSPAKRALAERRRWGMDHGALGGLVARRLGLPTRVALLIERHHAGDTEGDSAVVCVADVLAHAGAGSRAALEELVGAALPLGLSGDELEAILFELSAPALPRRSQPSPLSRQQTAVLRLVASGARSQRIAAELGLATSTVRSHISCACVRLGVSGRAQAVLVATGRGWL